LEDLTNKDIYASVKKPSKIEKIRLNRLHWFGHVQRMEGNSGNTGGLVGGIKDLLCLVLLLVKVMSSLYKA